MNTHEQIQHITETLSSMDQSFKMHIQELQHQLDILEALIEQLERRLRNLRNEG